MSDRRVLIVDDEEGIRTSLALILEDEGYEVCTAPGPEEALQVAREIGFDVVLCDIRMPKRSGLEILPDLSRLQPGATILMMSAYGDVDQALEAVRLGAYDYLAKPFQPQERLFGAGRSAHLIAFIFQNEGEAGAYPLFIIDDQNPAVDSRRKASPEGPASASCCLWPI